MADSAYHPAIAAMLQESLARGIHPRLRVNSSSMAPILQSGDQIIIEPVEAGKLRIGDILVIQREGDLLTHRLVAILPEGCQTKGDQHPLCDPIVSPGSILGRATAIERESGHIDLAAPPWPAVNTWLGILGRWEAKLYQYSPIARLPIRLITRIIIAVVL